MKNGERKRQGSAMREVIGKRKEMKGWIGSEGVGRTGRKWRDGRDRKG